VETPLTGRMPLWGLAPRGQEGAREVLELLREELTITLHLTGCRSIAEPSAANLGRRA
jgi:isopentenyl diphosphate isomerase/L-lactate dehydrogenase-like FMN-dependent dehydrogenase